MRLGIGLGQGPDAAAAARAAVREAKKAVPRPALALAFGGALLDQKRLHAALCEELDPKILMGGTSYAEITPHGVTKGTVAVLLLDLQGASAGLGHIKIGSDAKGDARKLAKLARPIERPGKGKVPLGLLISGGRGGGQDDFLVELGRALGRFPVFGGRTCGNYDAGMKDPTFWKTWQYSGPRLAQGEEQLALLGLPGSRCRLGFGFEHGWTPVGPEARVTKARRDEVFALDGMPIFDYYRQFSGECPSELFFSRMVQRFALALQLEGDYSGTSLLKIPINPGKGERSMRFNPPEDLQGRRVRLIMASRRGLVDGAREAAGRAAKALGCEPSLVLVVSCCTRNSLLNSRVGAEVQAVREVFGPKVPVFGFYSGGEVLPFLSTYDEIVDPSRKFSGSFWHAGTIGVLALSHLESPKWNQAARSSAEDSPSLRRQLAEAEASLDDSEVFLANLSKKSYEDGERLKRQNEVIHRYTPHDVYARIGQNADQGIYELKDCTFTGAFLFMDVKGYTAFSGTHSPPEVVSALNGIFDPATRIVYEEEGDVDKYIGDCIFAAFKKPIRAVSAAKRIMKLIADKRKEGSPFSVRIGINSGTAVRANVGAPSRREYTYIGDAVNLAQRLESNCPPCGLLVSEGVYRSAKRALPGALKRTLTVKGKESPVTAYEWRDEAGAD